MYGKNDFFVQINLLLLQFQIQIGIVDPILLEFKLDIYIR